jgi:hypothetical protein
MNINAQEARQLVEQSKAVLDQRLDKLGEKIREAASLGKRELYPADVLYHDDWVNIEKKPFYPPELTPVQRLIEKELKRHGFIMVIDTRNIKIGGGLGSMDDEVKYEDHPYMLIKW